MDPRKVTELKAFVQLCKEDPSVLHLPELGFVRTWLQRLVFFVCHYIAACSFNCK